MRSPSLHAPLIHFRANLWLWLDLHMHITRHRIELLGLHINIAIIMSNSTNCKNNKDKIVKSPICLRQATYFRTHSLA